MPTKRSRVSHGQAPQISPAILSILSEGLFPMPENSQDELITWKYFQSDDAKRKILEQCKDFILAEWTRQRPGTRPSWWWLSEAPEKARRRLGGIGDPAHEFLAYVETYEYGIPTIFLDQLQVSRLTDTSGRAVDPKDPPRYEAQATYLKRLDLLRPEEKRRLRKKDYEPKIISV